MAHKPRQPSTPPSTPTVSADGSSTTQPAPPPPVVSVIIVAFRSEATIAPCLRSVMESEMALRGIPSHPSSNPAPSQPVDRTNPSGPADPQDSPPEPDAPPKESPPLVEIIVVDNASGDETIPRVLQFGPRVRLIPNPDNRGFSRAVNQGLRASTAPFILLLNPDCRVEPDAIATLVAFMERTRDAGACGPKILSPDGTVQLSCRAFPSHSTALFHRHSLLTRFFPRNPHSDRYLKTRWDHSEQAQVDWVSGAAMMLRRSALRQIGGMDEDYFLYCEDVDLCWRLLEKEWGTYFVPEAIVWHHVGRSARQTPMRALYERHRSMYTFYKKHYSQDIPLIDFATFLGIALRCFLYMGLAAGGKSIGHHGEETSPRRERRRNARR